MTRQIRTHWLVGIGCLLVGNLVFASEQARLSSLEKSGAGLLFFPYPATVSIAGIASVRRVHPHFRFDQSIGTLNLASPNGVARYGSDIGRADSKSLPTPSPDAIRSQGVARGDDFASQDDDEWHFSANPQLGANHDHEKSVTFSLRHGF